MPGMSETIISFVEELHTVASALPHALQTRALDLVEEYAIPDMHPGFLLGQIQELRERVDALYDDVSYAGNPTREIWEFGLLLHQGLCEDDRRHLEGCRRRTRDLLLRCLASWTDKEEWERDVEVMLREQEEAEYVLTA